jgi:Tol biopolymer transport system component
VRPTADARSFSAVRHTTDSNIYTLELEPGRNGATRALTTGFGNWVGGGGVRWLKNGEVLFTASAGGMTTLFAVDAKGGTPRRLIHNMPVWGVAVSPDGARITFVSDKSGSPQIWVAEASGANPRQVTHGSRAGYPMFTPDGKSIVYLTFDETQFAWRVPLDGSTPPVRLTNVPTSRVQISPDGRQLLVRLRSKEPNVPIWRTAIVPIDGRGAPRYFDVPRHGSRPILLQWHPNGRAIVCIDFKNGVGNIWMQDLDGSEPRPLTFFESGDIFEFDLSPDGKRLALARGESLRDAVLIRNFR